MLPVRPHSRHVLEPGRGHEQGGLGIADAERAQALELVGEAQPEDAAGYDGIHPLDRDQVVGRQRAACVCGKGATEGLDGGRVELDPCRHAVSAVAAQVLGAGGEPGVQVVGRDAPARPTSYAVLERDDHARSMPALDEP